MTRKKRVIVVPRNNGFKSMEEVLNHLHGIDKTMGFVDDYLTVKNSVEQVVLKKCKIKSFRGESIEDFQDAFLDGVSEGTGTTFLICKN